MSKELVEGLAIPPWVLPPAPGKRILVDTITGPTGDSAYQSAVELGFVGDKQAWIDSLHATGILDPVTQMPSQQVVSALTEAIVEPYEQDQVLAYQLGKI